MKLEQDLLFVKSWYPYDFSRTMGQLAVELTYTNGDTQMLTTPIDPARGNDKGDFKDDAEMKAFCMKLQSMEIPRTVK